MDNLLVRLTLIDDSTRCGGQRNLSLNGRKKTMLLATCQAPEMYSKALLTSGEWRTTSGKKVEKKYFSTA